MKFRDLRGRPRNVNISPYLIDWGRKVSGPQKKVKDFLKKYWKNHVVLEEFRVPGCLLRVDILSLTTRTIIEIHGDQHIQFNKHFHGTREGFARAVYRDLEKEKWAQMNGFAYVEIYENDIDQLSEKWFRDKYGVQL